VILHRHLQANDAVVGDHALLVGAHQVRDADDGDVFAGLESGNAGARLDVAGEVGCANLRSGAIGFARAYDSFGVGAPALARRSDIHRNCDWPLMIVSK